MSGKSAALFSLLFKLAAEYAIRRAHVNQKGFKLNVTRQILLWANNVNTLGASKQNVKKNTQPTT